MRESSAPRSEQHPSADIAQTTTSPVTPSRRWALVMMIGGGLMAAWGLLVSAGILFVLVTREPAPEGPVPLILGGFVIGFSPTLFGGIVCRMGRKRLRTLRAEADGTSLATPT